MHEEENKYIEAKLKFNLAEMYLFSSECNFSAMLTSWELNDQSEILVQLGAVMEKLPNTLNIL